MIEQSTIPVRQRYHYYTHMYRTIKVIRSNTIRRLLRSKQLLKKGVSVNCCNLCLECLCVCVVIIVQCNAGVCDNKSRMKFMYMIAKRSVSIRDSRFSYAKVGIRLRNLSKAVLSFTIRRLSRMLAARRC